MMTLLLLLYPLQAELTVKNIDEMVRQIQGKRQSKVKVDFEKVTSPFASIVQEDVNATPILQTARQQVNFQLNAIVNDKAQINDRWVQVGDIVQGYKVDEIAEDHVVLKKANRSVEVFLPKPKKLLQFQIN
jgi:hypothetical protein